MGLYDFNQRDDEDDFSGWAKVLLACMTAALPISSLTLVRLMSG